MGTQELVVNGSEVTSKIYRHSENFKNDISFLMATDEMTVEDLVKIFFEGATDRGAQTQLSLELSNRD